MDAAHRSGELRTDIAVGDIIVAVTQLSRLLSAGAHLGTDRCVHRHLELLLDALQGGSRQTALPGAAITLDELRQPRAECDARH
ncbi:hypothetical protein ACFXPN_06640 [Streptomyces griseorubiginosus]|uniref:hypothetical protein n=1 Tax=Streptomyces griseorubiginosus TaxID=67304 RepID=UPI00367AB992